MVQRGEGCDWWRALRCGARRAGHLQPGGGRSHREGPGPLHLPGDQSGREPAGYRGDPSGRYKYLLMQPASHMIHNRSQNVFPVPKAARGEFSDIRTSEFCLAQREHNDGTAVVSGFTSP